MRCYVAIGDSFTAGIDPTQSRWADEVAKALGPDVRYENIATIGATSEDVERDQIDQGIAFDPDVVSLVCGANDVLLSTRPEPDAYAERLGRMFGRLKAELPRATVVTATYPDISQFLDLRPRTRARVEKGMVVFNEICRKTAHEHDVVLLEGFDHPDAGNREVFAEDGFHPSQEGHLKAAQEFVDAIRSRLGTHLQEVTQ